MTCELDDMLGRVWYWNQASSHDQRTWDLQTCAWSGTRIRDWRKACQLGAWNWDVWYKVSNTHWRRDLLVRRCSPIPWAWHRTLLVFHEIEEGIVPQSLSILVGARSALQKHNNKYFLRCLEAHVSEKVLQDLNDRPTRGNFAGNTTMHKVTRVGFYWPTLFKDAHAYARKCLFNSSTTPCCSDRTIPIVGPRNHWVNIPTFVKETPLHSNINLLLHVVDGRSSAKKSEQPGGYQLHTTEHHLMLWRSGITCFW